MNYQYYLDTNTVQSLGIKLETIPREKVFSSILAQIELVSAIVDEYSFRRKRAALKHMQNSGLFIDQILLEDKLLMAFDAKREAHYVFTDFSNHIMPTVIQANNYNELMMQLNKLNLLEVFNGLKLLDGLGSRMGDYIEKNKWPIIDYDNKWNGDKSNLLNDAVIYHAGRLEDRYSIPKWCSIMCYDHSIDYFMLIHYYYVEQKKHSGEKPARNDMNDIMHLLYLKPGCKLVTNDKKFQKYVNKMVDGLAIGTEQFLNEINYE